MANPTTNYSWVLPTPTDLVTDLPADFDVALQGVDNTVKALNPETTLGDISYRSSTANTNTRLAIGSTGNILTVAGGVPTWAAPASAGGMTLIATATPSAATTVSFTSIPTSYKSLTLVWDVYGNSSSQYFYIRLNNDSGANYNYRGIYNTGATATFTNVTAGTNGIGDDGNFAFLLYSNSSDIGLRYRGYMNLYETGTASDKRYFAYSNGQEPGPGNQRGMQLGGNYTSATALTQIDLIRSGASNTITGSVFLYGQS